MGMGSGRLFASMIEGFYEFVQDKRGEYYAANPLLDVASELHFHCEPAGLFRWASMEGTVGIRDISVRVRKNLLAAEIWLDPGWEGGLIVRSEKGQKGGFSDRFAVGKDCPEGLREVVHQEDIQQALMGLLDDREEVEISKGYLRIVGRWEGADAELVKLIEQLAEVSELLSRRVGRSANEVM